MKTLLFTLALLFSMTSYAQKLYELSTVQTIEITFAQSNWDALMDAEKAGDGNYIEAQSVTINGEVFPTCGVKYKGNSTYNSSYTKNPLHIELDTYVEQDYNGYTDIKLSNVANDPSFVREVLSYDIIRQYMDAPDANYANVYINGELIGLYSNAESVSKSFVKDKFYSNDNTFVKCNPPGGAGMGTTDIPNLTYLSDDSASYYNSYELKSDAGWGELLELIKAIDTDIDNIEDILDVDRTLWMHALNNVLVNLDSYSGQYAQNYYLYKDDHGKFCPVMWDFNESFGRFSQTGSITLNTTTDKAQMTHLLHEGEADYPLISKLFEVPMYKRMYIAHMKTILEENFESGSYYTAAQEMQTIVDASVQADPNKFFTYDAFISNLDSDYSSSSAGGRPGPPEMSAGTPGIKSLMDARHAYLLALNDFTATAPTIGNAVLSEDNPQIGSPITITVSASSASTIYLGYRNDSKDHFTKVQMYDDGAHGDGSSGDGVYGATIDVLDAIVEYYFYAENSNAGIFSPQRAQHEFYSFTATSITAPLSDVVINEFMASNDVTVSDQDGEYDDWIELYNNSTSAIDLSGYYLSDDAQDLTQWTFPSGTTIDGEGFLTIWADNDELQTGLHANFKLSSGGEVIYLSDVSGELIDEVSFLDQETDLSYGRYENGIGSFMQMDPTYGAANSLGTSTQVVTEASSELLIYPNPTSDMLYLESASDASKTLEVYSVAGAMIYSANFSTTHSIDVSTWEAGIYLLRANDTVSRVVVK